MRRRYVAYIRVANKSDDAVERQKQKIIDYANARDVKIDYFYIDNGYPGTTLDRPQLRQLLRDVKSRKITDEIFYVDNSRLSRDISGVHEIAYKVSKSKVKLTSLIKEEQLSIGISMTIAQMYIKDDKQRKIQATKFYNERAVKVISPHKRGTKEDFEFQKKKRQEFKDDGIYYVRFVYKDERKEKVK